MSSRLCADTGCGELATFETRPPENGTSEARPWAPRCRLHTLRAQAIHRTRTGQELEVRRFLEPHDVQEGGELEAKPRPPTGEPEPARGKGPAF